MSSSAEAVAPPSVTLFGHWICPYSVRVSFALAYKGINHELIEVPPSAVRPPGYVVPAEFVEHSPRCEIPMIRIDEAHLADSIPILELLEDRVAEPSMLGDDRDLSISRATFIDATVFPPMVGVYYGTEQTSIERSSRYLARSLDALVPFLATSTWLAGEEPSIADAVLVPLYVRLGALRRLGFGTALPDLVERHRAATCELDAYRAVAWSEEHEDELVRRCELARQRSTP